MKHSAWATAALAVSGIVVLAACGSSNSSAPSAGATSSSASAGSGSSAATTGKFTGCMVSDNEPSLDWVIVGGESGPRARPMKPEWAIDIRNQCLTARVPFFFKQWGGRTPKTGGRKLEGKVWSQFPKQNAALEQLELQAGA